MKTIQLTQNQIVLVDDCDYRRLMQWKWQALYDPEMKSFYAMRTNETRQTVRMHREITGAQKGEQVDHINHNTLDNRRCNLRTVSATVNMRNRRLQSNNSSGFCGVSFCNTTNKWLTRIGIKGKKIHIGYFHELEEAIAARKQANRKYGFHENHGRRITNSF